MGPTVLRRAHTSASSRIRSLAAPEFSIPDLKLISGVAIYISAAVTVVLIIAPTWAVFRLTVYPLSIQDAWCGGGRTRAFLLVTRTYTRAISIRHSSGHDSQVSTWFMRRFWSILST